MHPSKWDDLGNSSLRILTFLILERVLIFLGIQKSIVLHLMMHLIVGVPMNKFMQEQLNL